MQVHSAPLCIMQITASLKMTNKKSERDIALTFQYLTMYQAADEAALLYLSDCRCYR